MRFLGAAVAVLLGLAGAQAMLAAIATLAIAVIAVEQQLESHGV